MKLHRLVLTNYRGITHREIEFPDHGVIVVSGANEIGKTSMVEALDLLFDAKDRSSKKEVKQVKPTHADVGAEITAEISAGAYRFIYHKRFHKRPETWLRVLAPQHEQHTGDDAHERVLRILADSVDMDLWRAQRIWQAASTAAAELSGSDALSRALDAAAGEADTLSGTEPLLVDRIDEQYTRYFTATGRATGELAAAVKRLQSADAEVARCAAAVAEVEDAVARHAALTADLEALTAQQAAAQDRLVEARAEAEASAALRRRLEEAELVATAEQATRDATVAALTERRRLRAEIDERSAAIGALEVAVADALEAEGVAGEVKKVAEQEADAAREAVEHRHEEVDAARVALQRISDREESDRLASRLARLEGALRDRAEVEAEIAGIPVTDAVLRDVDVAAQTVDRAAGQADLASARIELTALTGVEVTIAGKMVALAQGDTWSVNTTISTDVELPGVLTARIVPGAPAAQTQERLDEANAALAAALHAAGVDDVAAARESHVRRRTLVGRRDALHATIEALSGDEAIDALRARLAALTEGMPAEDGLFDVEGPVDVASARERLDAAVAAHRQAIVDCETRRKVAVAAADRMGQATMRTTVAREKAAAARTELASATERLAAARAGVDDDALAIRAQAEGEAAALAAAQAQQLREQWAAGAPDEVAVEHDDAARAVALLDTRCRDAAEALREITATLKVYGTEGRQGRLDAARTEREHAHSDHERVYRRARAAQLLRDVMTRHRSATRQRYVDPFRQEVERLGRVVFGETFEVQIDSDLNICNRTLAGRTVAYDSLSGGAKEQLAIVARLAGAALVAKEDAVPVVIDDALGFTDPDRLVKMGAVFDVVGGAGQVIVLTCNPERYAAVDSAHRITLTTDAAVAS
ncbi:AAA family ATPase [Mycolicibacterium sp. F2034L]|uniref:AAA family ATPase n=1 Tax=Mycolicibacterium sp. F2034L TaxID=2926422 RepID=UPI001FF3E0BA|nr:AAA family ATPase [Mycolicibacterium sp. F2034L]MCK0173177.1 AAA family ATPase [Mycolicibacterium sp. F2034L]